MRHLSDSPRRRAASLALVACGLVLASCSRFDPTPPAEPAATQPVQIVVNTAGTSTEEMTGGIEQEVIADLYKYTLLEEGRAAVVVRGQDSATATATPNADPLGGNLFVGCTGVLLDYFDAPQAQEISQDFVQDKHDASGEDYLARTHIALMGSLPADLAVVEPSSAEGCASARPQLPENYVAVYEKGIFDREQLLAVSSLTKFLTKEEIDKIIAQARATSVEEATRSWVSQSSGAGSLDTGGDKDSSNKADASSAG
ncbi:hypothetical protein [Corynebacterium flavescens]|uniref:hypothetical protein n=1 Tax=Corynebacterium flavescens TaxID=28028 RepID=UPI002647815F|nr:hypothetical protein [Corynebacterium flavescens]MDN6226143.1 hypothetical protein [Corynebacterium flavescens]MDN6602045.1 hypothetical protein [Corynebacterium flavescens]